MDSEAQEYDLMRLSYFTNKTKATNYIKYQLNYEFKVGDKIKEGDLFQVLTDMIRNHYNGENLEGGGIDYFFITRCDINKRNRKFNIMRLDGSTTDFSYRKAISGRTPKNTDDLKIKKQRNMSKKYGWAEVGTKVYLHGFTKDTNGKTGVVDKIDGAYIYVKMSRSGRIYECYLGELLPRGYTAALQQRKYKIQMKELKEEMGKRAAKRKVER